MKNDSDAFKINAYYNITRSIIKLLLMCTVLVSVDTAPWRKPGSYALLQVLDSDAVCYRSDHDVPSALVHSVQNTSGSFFTLI